MPPEESVNVLDSLTNEDEDSPESGSGKKENSSESSSDGRSEKNVASERLRKENELLKTKMEEMKSSFEERIKELEDKPTLTQNQADELYKLRVQVDSLKSNPEAKPWIEMQREIAREELKKMRDEEEPRVASESIDMALDWVDTKAETLKVDIKKFQEELFDILEGGRWSELSPLSRVKRAYSNWLKTEEKMGSKKIEVEHSETPGKKLKAITGAEAIKEGLKPENQRALLAQIAKIQSKPPE